MPGTPSKREAEDFVRHWLSEHFGFRAETLHRDHILPIDLGVTGVHGDQLIAALHEKFGTDFSELDADAGFGIEDRTPTGGLATIGQLLRDTVPRAPERPHQEIDGPHLDPWEEAWVRVGDLIDAVRLGSWPAGSGRRPRRVGRQGTPGQQPGKPPASVIGTLGRVSGRAFTNRTREQIARPGFLPNRALRVPWRGFRRESALRCPWCGRRELVFLDTRFGDHDFTCAACDRDATLRCWSRALVRLSAFLGFGAHIAVVVVVPAVPWLLGWKIVGAWCFLAALTFGFFLMTGLGQARRLPDGARPRSPDTKVPSSEARQ